MGLGVDKEEKMEIILKGKKEEKFFVDEELGKIIKDLISKKKQEKAIRFMLENAGKLKDLEINEKDIYMQGDK